VPNVPATKVSLPLNNNTSVSRGHKEKVGSLAELSG